MVLPEDGTVVPKHVYSYVFSTEHLVGAVFEHAELSNFLVSTMDCAVQRYVN
jgi:hypothetical protein